MKITIERPENMKHNRMPEGSTTYDLVLTDELSERFRKGGRLVLEIEESADLLTFSADVRSPRRHDKRLFVVGGTP